MIAEEENWMRERWGTKNLFYSFTIKDKTIDSKHYGNKSRFLNHSKEPNCEARSKIK